MPESTTRPARRTAAAAPTELEPEAQTKVTTTTSNTTHTDAGTDRIIVLALLVLAALCLIGVTVSTIMGKATNDFLVTTGGACVGALAMRARGSV